MASTAAARQRSNHTQKDEKNDDNERDKTSKIARGGEDDNQKQGGDVDWRCATVILILIFIVVFVGSVAMSMQGFFPLIVQRLLGQDGAVRFTEPHVHDRDQPDITVDDFLAGVRLKAEKERNENLTPKPVLDKPTILWWTDALYPHAHRGSISEVTCGDFTCQTTGDKRLLSDPLLRGIMFYGTDFRAYEAPLPREPWHEWALLHEESPMNNYALVFGMKLFNHSATFRRESDYPTTTHTLPDLDYLTKRMPVPIAEKNRLRKEEKLAPILYVQSHCDVSSDRDRYVEELMKHVKVDSYGKCLNNKKMPEHLSNPVESMEAEDFYDFISKYKFHLAFENAVCDDYITEKFFRPFHVGSVPVYRGSSRAQDWAPSSKSFLDVNEFESPQQLGYFIRLLDEHDDVYLNYLEFKERGVSNQVLIQHMRNRPYAVNKWNKHSFISGFECHVCQRISERFQAEQDGKEMEKKIGQSDQMGCGPPFHSFGNMEDIPESDGIHSWIQDYWGMRDQVVALEELIEEKATDASTLFEIVERNFNDHHLSP